MKRTIILASLLLFAGPSYAADLSLNDLPGVLQKLRGCAETKSFLNGTTTRCAVEEKDLWASIKSDGSLTLFKSRSYGDTTYANGRNVNELLRDFAAKINENRDGEKQMLDALAPYLESQ